MHLPHVLCSPSRTSSLMAPCLRLSGRLELEPLAGGRKKRGLLSQLNRLTGSAGAAEVRSLDSGGSRTGPHTGYRNWGLAEELEPSPA